MPTETATTITMPKLGESVTEGTVGAWLKGIGDPVAKYEPLLEVFSDKVNTEVPSPVAGVLVEILVDPETTVPVGAGICRIAEAGAAGIGAVPEPSPGPSGAPPNRAANGHGAASGVAAPAGAPVRRAGEVPDELDLLRARSSPVVRRIAAEHGVELAGIAGSGVGGRVTKGDLLAHLAATEAAQSAGPAPELPAAPSAPTPAPAPAVAAAPAEAPPATRVPLPLFPGDEAVPLSPMRRAIAEHMVRSERTAPHVTVVMEVDMTRAVAWRAARKDEFRVREGVELTFLPLALKAVTLALRAHPRLNAAWDEDRIVHRRAVNLGVAVALEDGLVVPTVKHADRLSVAGLAHAVAELAGKARAGTLTPDDLAGGTFTVNNPGTFGSIVSTPILVQPQVGILSTEAIVKRPVVVDDMIAIRSMMNLSLSIDHRVLDGLAAARFLGDVKRWLEGVDDGLALY